jgi:hypothetical protein
VTSVLLFATTTGYQIRSFGEAARTLGVRLVFASDRCDRLDDPWWDQAIPVRFHDEEPSIAAVLAACAGAPPAAVLAVGDRPAVLAARVAAALGLPGNPADAVEASANKLASRAAFSAAGLPVPPFEALDLADDPVAAAARVGYPVVIKPLALSGSRGVMRVDAERDLGGAFARLRRLLQSPDVLVERDRAHGRALVERFIPGRELAIEGLLSDGVFRALAIFDKPDPLDGPFFEETIYVTPSRERADVQRRLVEACASAARALGLRHGPVHAECRVNAAGVYVLEVAARPIGGLCARALRFRAPVAGRLKAAPTYDGERAAARTYDGERPEDVSLEELLLRHALGEDVAAFAREPRASGVMMIPIPRRGVLRGVDGVDAARAVRDVEDVQITAKIDSLIVPLPEGRSYLGFVFARGEDAAGVERALRDAHARLRFDFEREVAVVEP